MKAPIDDSISHRRLGKKRGGKGGGERRERKDALVECDSHRRVGFHKGVHDRVKAGVRGGDGGGGFDCRKYISVLPRFREVYLHGRSSE